MPVSVVKTPAEEKKWQRAKELAAEAGREDDYAYVMGIFKKMNPERFGKHAAGEAQMSRIRRIVARHLRRKAYEEGHRAEGGWGWDPGSVEEGNIFHGMGSQFPPVRDGKGQMEVPPEIPEGTGVDAMLSRSEIPRFARRR